MANFSTYKNLELPVNPEHYDINVFNKNAMVIDSELHKLDLKNQSQDNLLATKEALNAEISRAENKENEIEKNLNDEITRAKSTENGLSSDINNEINRAATAEMTINDSLSLLISELTTRLNALADSDDTTLDQLSEIVAYIKNNKTLIDGITTSKVSVSDIIDNLTSTATDKVLSANQGRILKELITTLTSTVDNKVDKISGKGLSANDYTTDEKNKLGSIESGAKKNVQSDWNVTDSTSDAFIKNKPTISTNTDTKNTAGATDTSSKIFLIGATSQAANPQTYSHDTVFVDTNGCLYSCGVKTAIITESLPILNSAPTYSTLADFWTAFNGLAMRTVSLSAIMRFKAENWAPFNGWFRAIVSAQNYLGNGQWDVTGQIILMDGSNVYNGKVKGGVKNASDLSVAWTLLSSNSGGITYSDSQPTSLTAGMTWIGN